MARVVRRGRGRYRTGTACGGDGGVYVADGSTVTDTNVAEEDRDRAMSLYNVTSHVLTPGDRFSIEARTPVSRAAKEVDAELGSEPSA